MITKTKICGIATTKDYVTCRDAGAAFVGMVHYPGSSRHLDLDALAKLATCSAATGPNAPDRVLLSVDVLGDGLLPLIEAGRPDLLQLHGNETPEEVAAIKASFGLPIIKSIAINTRDDLVQCSKWDGVADWLLFDAKVKPGTQPGGTGHSFDWDILRNYKGRLPWMLAGGLDKINVVDAIRVSGARVVDVSSGVELTPGKKDASQIHAFIRATQLVKNNI
jgi:phosphoribosylanthranilate isomerase